MQIIKRDGRKEMFSFDKVVERLKMQSYQLDHKSLDVFAVATKVLEGVYNGITAQQVDELVAEVCASFTTKHPDYAILASRIEVSNLHKETKKSFSATMKDLYNYVDENTGKPAPLIAKDVYKVIEENAKLLDSKIIQARDFEFDYFGFKTLEKSYLLKINDKIVERPQYMFMRVAIGIHKQDIQAALETYELLSQKWFTHATPTLFNAGTPNPQLSSCFLVAMKDDSIEGIFDTLKQCAEISKYAGGIGLHVHNIRGAGSYIRGTNGMSNGLVPMLQVYNHTARYVDQGGGKRKGSFAIYLEPWHSDIFEFLELKKNTGKEEMRARDLFYALWIPDLFMRRVLDKGEWSLFCPNEAPGLSDVYGKDFEKLYLKYEKEGKAKKTVKAQDLWFSILQSQIETGTPYMLYKDACNEKSNQKNLGTIKSSNLCTEILEYTSKDEVAVCNLASIALPRFVEDGKFNHQKLAEITKVVTRNLNKVIDVTYYPIPEAENSNKKHRPIGIGVQGLADTFILLRMPFDSDAAKQLNREIFETIYYAALSASVELAKEIDETPGPVYRTHGKGSEAVDLEIIGACRGSYESFPGSPASQGILQYDMWNVIPTARWNWAELKDNIKKYGLRNSLLIAPMPTASTSQILGNNECIEPYTSNIYNRRVLSGEFILVNKHLIKDLVRLGLWNTEMKNRIIMANGSVQGIAEIPQDIKEIYKTVWEIKQRVLIDMAADRGAFICQSQSLNLFMEQPNYAKLSSMHFYAWEKGLKTGMYYLRTKAAADAIKFTVEKAKEDVVCSIENKDECQSCGS